MTAPTQTMWPIEPHTRAKHEIAVAYTKPSRKPRSFGDPEMRLRFERINEP